MLVVSVALPLVQNSVTAELGAEVKMLGLGRCFVPGLAGGYSRAWSGRKDARQIAGRYGRVKAGENFPGPK